MNSQLKSRPSTIVWGAILAAVAAITILASTHGFDVTGPSTVLWLVVGVGGLLVLGAVIGGIIRAVRGQESPASVPANRADAAWPFDDAASASNTVSTPEGHQPID